METIVRATLNFLGQGDSDAELHRLQVDEADPREVKRDERGKRSLDGKPGQIILHYRG